MAFVLEYRNVMHEKGPLCTVVTHKYRSVRHEYRAIMHEYNAITHDFCAAGDEERQIATYFTQFLLVYFMASAMYIVYQFVLYFSPNFHFPYVQNTYEKKSNLDTY